MAGLPVPFLTPSRCVLLITDDALCVYDVTSRGSELLEAVPWRRPEFESTVADIITNRAGGRAVMIVNDAVEQHYRKEKVPRITLFDRSSIVQRRLTVAFPNYPIRAAMELQDRKARGFSFKSSGPGEGQSYLFAALPSSDAYSKTLEAIARSGAAVAGFCLLPVESAGLVKTLADKLSKRKRTRSGTVWSVLIGQHHGGGLRQIVTKNGELALTRITPVTLPTDAANTQTWCVEVAQEFQATLSYLSRFGYNPDDGLTVMVVAGQELGEKLESLIDAPCVYHSLTVPQAAQLLGIGLGRNADAHYADSLHAAWIGKKFSPDLALTSRDLKRISNPRRAASILMLLTTVAFGCSAFMNSNEAQAIYRATKNLEVAAEQKRKIDAIYAEELKRKESMGIDVKLIQGSIKINDAINAEKVDPLPLLRVIAQELKTLRIDGFEFTNKASSGSSTPAASSGTPGTPPPARDFSLLLEFSFAGTVKPQDGNAEIKQFIDRLAEKLPDYQVAFEKKLQDMSYTGAMTEETGLTATTRDADDRYVSQVKITRKPNDQGAQGK